MVYIWTTVTLEVPDELAVQLGPLQDRLPTLLFIAVELMPAEIMGAE